MYHSYKRMALNLGLFLLCLSSAMEGANAAANGSFSLKYYNVEFDVSPSFSSLLASKSNNVYVVILSLTPYTLVNIKGI